MTPTASEPAAPHPAASRRGIALLGMLVAFGALSIDMYLPSLPDIATSLATSPDRVQATLTTFFAGFGTAMLVYGPLSDAIGRRPLLLSGIVVFIVASIGCAFAASVEQLIVLRFLQAAGGAAAAVLGRAIVRDIFPPAEAPHVLSTMALVMALGPLLAPLIGGQILRFAEWPAIFLVLAGYGALCLVAAWRMLPETLPASRRRDLHLGRAFLAYGRILADRVSFGYLLASGFAFAAMFAYITGTPFVYIEYFGVPREWYGVLFGMNIVSQMSFTYLNTRLVRRLGPERMTLIGVVVGFAGAALLLLAGLTGLGGLPLIVVALLPVVGVTALVGANSTAIALNRFPENAGAAAATFTAGMFGFGALSSVAVGMVHDGTPAAMAIVIFGCSTIALLGRLFGGAGAA
ncbi:MAG: Bcr/CflA family multidrug efflux MFS transporter [Hyphomicrobiales bacterium]